ncbi:MFS transporter [Paraburkholderia sp. Ac-20336]|uniref:MFS transporter n=1 Tax=Paraburkholderia sp. Ac-20336 TaxID=2703886 RepID=UPI0019809704|nr:MFS transporter [Paraburkholderia sp. Ac-20336]MBN3804903.1 MFS transporter [Paraburkholderia sp. Ac-20336]
MQVCDLEPQAATKQCLPSDARRNILALFAVCLAAMMFGLEISSVPAILPTLEGVLHADFKQMQWIMNAYTIACTTVLMATGTLADRFGRKRMFIVSIVLFGIASLWCGLASSAPVLIASRFLQGASGGAMLICLVAVLSHQFPQGAERARAFSAWGIILGIGLGFGPLIGSAIVALSSWQWVFWVHVLISIVTLVLAVPGVRESRDPHASKLDVAGMVTLSGAVFGFVSFITQGADIGFTSRSGIAIFVASTASLVAFFAAEMRSAHPMFDFSVFRIRNFSGALLGSVGMNFSFWPFIIYLPIYFQHALGASPMVAGLFLLAYTLPTLVFPPIGERLALRYSPAIVIPAGLFTIGLGFFLMRMGSAFDHTSALAILPGCFVAGAGLGIANTPVTNTTTGSASGTRAGMASGIDMSARMITLAINIAMMGLLLVKGVAHRLQDALPAAPLDISWDAMANRIAIGDLHPAAAAQWPALSSDGFAAISRGALVHGFEWLMLYGGIAVCTLAVVSYLIFSGGKVTHVKRETIADPR